MTVEEILKDLGVEVDPAKAEALSGWNGKLTALETDSQTKLTAAEKAKADAEALQRVIDDNIAQAGMTETEVAQLRASNAALSAAMEEIKKQGFDGLKIPDLPKPAAQDPAKAFLQNITNGFAQVGQTLNEMNRYQRVTGKALPEDPATIADRAAASHLSVHDYMERTYKLSEKEQELAKAEHQKEMDAYAAKAVDKWKAEHPNTIGNPDLTHGMPSNYPTMPKPREGKTLREFAGMSTRDKIQSAMKRASEAVQAQNAA